MGVDRNKQSIINYINDLTLAIGIPEKFQVNQLDRQLQDSLIENALNDPCLITNPREMNKEDAERIYDKIIQQKNNT